ncbi:uncharacterized protein [Spinacia oleracea]|uniref:CCHC-type domain-containing protein n=1 Tax=Spinacia oleracea TaxID=3562 RepID=A0A9R0I5L0_SPIOL|nr:uncharacterized protein LOC110783079 [Spinacia oleracea]
MVEGEKPSGSSTTRYEPFTDYYLHPSEGTHLVISPILLTTDNYEEWSRSFRNNLRAKSKLGFIDGSITMPDEESPDFRQWGIVNSTIVAWIYNTLDASVRSNITFPDDAKILWDDLKHTYSLGNGPRILEIKHAISDCKQRGRPVATYYGELHKYQNLLSSYSKLPACTCSAASEYAKIRDTEMLHQFCIGLDSKKFGTVVSTLLMSDPLPTMNVAYAKIIADERKQAVSEANEVSRTEAVRFTASGTASGRTTERRECSHCGKFGHIKETCFELHGYSEGSRGGRTAGRSGRGAPGGRNTGRGRGGFAANVGAGTGTRGGAHEHLSEADRGSVPTITDAQWHELMAVVKGSKASTSSDANKLGPQFESPDWRGGAD